MKMRAANVLDVPRMAMMWAAMMQELDTPDFEFNDFGMANFVYNQTVRLHQADLCDKNYAFLAFNGDEDIGFISGGLTSVPGTAQVEQLYGRPDARMRGVAQELMGVAIRWANERGLERVQILAHPSKLAFYEKHGFRTQHVLMMGAVNYPKLRELAKMEE